MIDHHQGLVAGLDVTLLHLLPHMNAETFERVPKLLQLRAEALEASGATPFVGPKLARALATTAARLGMDLSSSPG